MDLNVDEVIVRRVIGAKSDHYFLQGKVIRRAEWISMMEIAGFTPANPFYIVKQGQVNYSSTLLFVKFDTCIRFQIMDLAMCSDEKRLDLVKDLGGVSRCEKQLKEATELLAKSEGTMNEIEELMTDVRKDIECYNKDKEELEVNKII